METVKRHLLAIKAKDKSYFVLEFENEKFLDGKKKAAEELNLQYWQPTGDDLAKSEFENAKFFDMRDPVVCKIFFLDQWIHFFAKEE